MALFTLYERIPFALNIITGPVVSYIAVVLNIVILFALFDKNVKSPATVLMQGLALADMLTALCTYGFEPLFSSFYQEIGKRDTPNYVELIVYKKNLGKAILENYTTEGAKALVGLEFPYCIIHYIVTQLSDTFHLVSVLLTLSLGLQKMLVIIFPLLSLTRITIRKSALVCLICLLVSVSILIPKVCVVRIHETFDGTCSILPPENILEKYVLSYHPIIFTVILACSVCGMVVSTCFIIVTLCCRRHIKGQCSTKEKKSCVLTLIVMIVFLITEIPRIYLQAALIHTFRSDLDPKEDVAWSKVQTEIQKKYTACYKEVENEITYIMMSDLKLKEPVSCEPGSHIIPESISLGIDQWENHLKFVINYFYGVQLKDMFTSPYGNLVDTLMSKLSLIVEKNIQRSYPIVYNIIGCYNRTDLWYQGISESIVFCDDRAIVEPFKEHLPFLFLGSTPYSEPTNYMLNIIWTNINISLEQFKLLIEVLKLSMVVGCASNFVIYIAMSEKLREALKRKIRLYH